jgi:hypothetical protein
MFKEGRKSFHHRVTEKTGSWSEIQTQWSKETRSLRRGEWLLMLPGFSARLKPRPFRATPSEALYYSSQANVGIISHSNFHRS